MNPARMRPAGKRAAATWREVLVRDVLPEVDSAGGQRLGEGEGLIYFNARYYDPTTGRFLTEDPSRQGVNWYAYCGNNPVNRTDPTGRYDRDDTSRGANQQQRQQEIPQQQQTPRSPFAPSTLNSRRVFLSGNSGRIPCLVD